MKRLAAAFLLLASCCIGDPGPPPVFSGPTPAFVPPAAAPARDAAPALVVGLPRGSGIRSLAIAPDGSTVAVGTDAGTVEVWDLATKELRASLAAHAQEVRQIAWSADGRRLVTASVDVRVWDAATGKPLAMIGGPSHYTSSFALAPDGASLVVWQPQHALEAWSVAPLARTAVLDPSPAFIEALAYHPAGKPLVAVSHSGGPVRVLDVRTGREVARLEGATTRAEWSPDGTRLVYAAGSDVVSWRGPGASTRWSAGRAVRAPALSPDGNLVALAGKDPVVEIRDAFRGTLVRAVKTAGIAVEAVVWSGDGLAIAAQVQLDQSRYETHVHRVSDGARIGKLEAEATYLAWAVRGAPLVGAPYRGTELALWGGHGGSTAQSIAWRDESAGARIALGPGVVWDAATHALWDLGGRKRATLPEDAAPPLWNPGKSAVAFQRIDQAMEHVDFFDLGGAPLGTFAWKKAILFPESPDNFQFRISSPEGLAFSPPGDRLAVRDADDRIDLRDGRTGRLERTLAGSERSSRMAWSRDGATLLTLSTDTKNAWTLALWDAASGARRRAVPCPPATGTIAAAPDLAWIAIGGPTTKLVDTASGAVKAELAANGDGGLATDEGATVLAAWPSHGFAGGVTWLDPRSRAILGSFPATDAIDVSVAPDGRTLAIAEPRHLVLVDAATGARRVDLPLEIVRTSKLGWLEGGKVAVVQGPVHLVRVADGAVLSLRVDGVPVAWTSSGAWSGSGAGIAHLRYRKGGLLGPATLVPATAGDPELHREHLVDEFLAGRW